MTELHVADLIMKKRDGKELGKEEIDYFIHGLVTGQVSDAQTGQCCSVCDYLPFLL